MIARLRIIPFLFLLITSACGSQEERPKGVLEKERFTELLTELYVLEGEAEYRQANFSEDPEEFLSAGTARIFKEHEVQREQFVRSFRYYMKHPGTMKAIHEEVLNELMRKEGKKPEGKAKQGE